MRLCTKGEGRERAGRNGPIGESGRSLAHCCCQARFLGNGILGANCRTCASPLLAAYIHHATMLEQFRSSLNDMTFSQQVLDAPFFSPLFCRRQDWDMHDPCASARNKGQSKSLAPCFVKLIVKLMATSCPHSRFPGHGLSFHPCHTSHSPLLVLGAVGSR